MSSNRRFEQLETDEAAKEAALIGGDVADEAVDPALRAVSEGGGGESEGFELAERELIEHASHADQQSAHAILHHQGLPEEPGAADADETGDHEQSSELDAEQ